VTLSALCDALGVTHTVAQVLVDVLDAVVPAGSAPGGGGEPGAGVDAHHLLLLLFVNTYSRPHVQSAIRNAGDVWPAGDTQAQQPQAGSGSTASPAPGGAAHALQVATASKSGLSPTKTARRGGALHGVTGSAAEDEVLQRSFVLRHLSALLPLLRSTPAAGTAGCVIFAMAEPVSGTLCSVSCVLTSRIIACVPPAGRMCSSLQLSSIASGSCSRWQTTRQGAQQPARLSCSCELTFLTHSIASPAARA
jgi:hypothetical protein